MVSAYQSTVKRILGKAKETKVLIYTKRMQWVHLQEVGASIILQQEAKTTKKKKEGEGNKSDRILICETFSGNATTLIHDVLIIHVHMALPWSSVGTMN